ncbi:MAG TPA: 2-C-methyl-D-erythritol 4-phosphate cytidylyltransferase [Nitrospiraceae bacterium]|nr:2-C-methyl-D-erythritol 4-phosphate cytidylyltransferase [Nitrospiraceae bacterium]
MDNRVVAVVPAAGRGHRMGSNTPKQFLTLGGLPLLVHSLRVLESSDAISAVVLAAPQAELDYCRRDIVAQYGFKKVRQVVAGGAERQDSVRLGLAAVSPDAEIVLIHDAVRPFLTGSMIALVVEAAAKHGAAIVAIPMRDTVKRTGPDGLIEETVDRRPLWLAQTPQAFHRALIEEAHARALQNGFRATDDAQLVECMGRRVAIVEGSTDNIKITRPEDLAMGESILASRAGT